LNIPISATLVSVNITLSGKNNEDLLISGTFLGNNEFERQEMKLTESTISFWSYLNRPDVITNFLNPMYEPNKAAIWPSIAPVSLVLWEELYLRSTRLQI